MLYVLISVPLMLVSFVKLFDSTIPRAVKVAETTRLGESILSYDKNSKIAESYKNFAKEVINYEREEKARNTNAVQVR